MSQNAKEKFFENKARLWTTIIVVLLILGVVLYAIGFRIGGKYLIGKVGSLEMTIPLKNTSIYIDQTEKIITSEENQDTIIPLSPGNHSIIVSHEGYYPWTKEFEVPSGGRTELKAIFASQNASGLIIGPKDPEYVKIKESITKSHLPTKASPITSQDGKVTAWIEGNSVLAQVNGELTDVIDPTAPIRNIDFYKGRSDALVFSTGDNIYVVEVSHVGTQNFLPLYVGHSPSFVTADSNSLYVLDGNSLLQVTI